jgi:hypothetical protein
MDRDVGKSLPRRKRPRTAPAGERQMRRHASHGRKHDERGRAFLGACKLRMHPAAHGARQRHRAEGLKQPRHQRKRPRPQRSGEGVMVGVDAGVCHTAQYSTADNAAG